jgi:hypothetical protein
MILTGKDEQHGRALRGRATSQLRSEPQPTIEIERDAFSTAGCARAISEKIFFFATFATSLLRDSVLERACSRPRPPGEHSSIYRSLRDSQR